MPPNSITRHFTFIEPLKTSLNQSQPAIKNHPPVTVSQITELALALFAEDKSPERNFSKTFAYCFELLVDAQYQLEHLNLEKHFAATHPSATDRQHS
jgi:hypothetical protein